MVYKKNRGEEKKKQHQKCLSLICYIIQVVLKCFTDEI